MQWNSCRGQSNGRQINWQQMVCVCCDKTKPFTWFVSSLLQILCDTCGFHSHFVECQLNSSVVIDLHFQCWRKKLICYQTRANRITMESNVPEQFSNHALWVIAKSIDPSMFLDCLADAVLDWTTIYFLRRIWWAFPLVLEWLHKIQIYDEFISARFCVKNRPLLFRK